MGDYLNSSKDDLCSQEIKEKHKRKERDRGRGPGRESSLAWESGKWWEGMGVLVVGRISERPEGSIYIARPAVQQTYSPLSIALLRSSLPTLVHADSTVLQF